MNILVSACLLGENCKYNGGNNLCLKVAEFVKEHKVFPVCPEVMGGLPVPRNPAEICNGKVMTADGTSVDKEFHDGAAIALQVAKENNISLAILQPRSPSCGCKQIYDGTFSKSLITGKGVFAELLTEKGIRTIEPEDL